ncbi:ABC transporter permease [Ktedonosporobacter rubrisoli]|uniref:ABC transporter permease n=1 Tax=Ktedonosporobacter rubrisoli TaxID=2509675 RepID=UPI001F5DC632|nr:ABC transporter permease [Ktedonosporobacter rubrisoli]
MFLQIFLRVLSSSDLWAATLQFGALLLLPALGGLISERSGVINIAMEGMMLTGAYAGVMTARATNSVIGGVIGAIVAGALIALVHAIVSINFKADQIVSGIAINIAALGLTNFLLPIQTGGQGVPSLGNALRLPNVSWGPLSHIPFLGPVFFQQNIIFYVAILILLGIQLLLFRTNIGLRIRAVGEHPQAADTAGVNVRLVRYCCVLAGGALSGLSGAFLSLGIAGIFNSNMTAGTGFIALAAMVFGKYLPWWTAAACIVFGLGEALSVRLQDTGISPNLLSTLPYILTLIALVGIVGRTVAPAADGIPYEPGSE